ncbi:MAG: hypothetical protein R3C03_06550 [Pirellulaceae bacterium]
MEPISTNRDLREHFDQHRNEVVEWYYQNYNNSTGNSAAGTQRDQPEANDAKPSNQN